MLNDATAIGLIKAIDPEHGANEPLLVHVQTLAGELLEAYIKLADGKGALTTDSLIIEAIASMIAQDLELPTPESFLVKITPEFTDSLESQHPQIAGRLRNSCPIALGTKNLSPGFTNVPPAITLDSNRQLAAEILAFDALIENPDRSGRGSRKTNCLIKDGIFYIFDHEKALAASYLMIFGRKNPWQLGGLEEFKQPNYHLFINQLRKCVDKLDFLPFVERWKTRVTNARVDEYMGSLPIEWLDNPTCAQNIRTMVTNLRDNIEDCVKELQRVLR